MRDFYRAYVEHPEVLAEAMSVGWTQNVVILEAELTLQDKLWYIRAVRRFGWSKVTLAEKIASAATSTEETGNPIYPLAWRKLTEHGVSCEGKTARRLTNSDYDQYDLLIGMDRANLRNMHRICGGNFAGKLHLLMDYTDHPGDVADPWYTDDFETTWRDVLTGDQELLKRLRSREGK